MTPIRGQIVRVRNPGLERCVPDEKNPEGLTYIVPRSDDCILSGTAEEGEWDTEPNLEVATESCAAVWRWRNGFHACKCWKTRWACGRSAQRSV